MKRLVLFILVLILMVDFTEDGYLGKVKFCPPYSSSKTAVTASHGHPDSGPGQSDFQHDLAFRQGPADLCGCEARPVKLQVPPTLKIMHCCHLSSSGGIPL